MVATYKVKDSTGKTAGFIINDTFYTDDYIKNNINYVDNLVLTENGVIKATKELPVTTMSHLILSCNLRIEL